MENHHRSNSNSGRTATPAWLGATLPLSAWLSSFHTFLAPWLVGEHPEAKWRSLRSLFPSARPPSAWLVSASSLHVLARLEPWTALSLGLSSPHRRRDLTAGPLDRSYRSRRRGKPRGTNLDVVIGSDDLSSPMAIGTTSPTVREERGDEPGDSGPHREWTLPNFSLPSEGTQGSFSDTVQIGYPEERAAAVSGPWSIPAKVFGVLSRLISGQGQASVPAPSFHSSHRMGVSGDHAPASDSWPGSVLRAVAPVYRKMPETRASHTLAQEHTAEHRDESAPQSIAAAPVGATAMRPIGRLGEDFNRALGRWQEKLPAVGLAFLARPVRTQTRSARTATGTADEHVPGRPDLGDMPLTTGDSPSMRPNDLPFPVARGIELTTHDRVASTMSAAHEWPVLNLLPRLEAIVSRGAKASEPSGRIAGAIPALQSLPALGPGEPLVEPVRPVMEKLTGRDLSQVRVYSSPAAEALGAEAFTSGQRIVFAPGRMDLRSSRGLALLGHELAHLGQPLALKANWIDALSNVEEHVALDQESAIQRLFESGEITPPRMDLLRIASESRPTERSTSVESNAPISGALDTSLVTPADFANPEQVPTSQPSPGTVHVSSRQTADVPVAAPSSPNATSPSTPPSDVTDVDALARQVYDLLKDRLRSERERHELYSR
jgi:hypothetical protein